jgi:hypothetical protein
MSDCRQRSLKSLSQSLDRLKTPPHVIEATIQHGFSHWIATSSVAKAPTAGRLGEMEKLLTTA